MKNLINNKNHLDFLICENYKPENATLSLYIYR